MGGLYWYSEERPRRAASPSSPLLLAIPCNSPPINGQCINFILLNVALHLPLPIKGLNTKQTTHISKVPYSVTLEAPGTIAQGRHVVMYVGLSNIYGWHRVNCLPANNWYNTMLT